MVMAKATNGSVQKFGSNAKEVQSPSGADKIFLEGCKD